MQPDEMQVYIANLGKYNEGELVGAWFHFPLDFDVIKERIGLNHDYEEYAIHDYELPVRVGEYESISHLNKIYDCVQKLADTPLLPATQALINEWFGDLEELVEHADDINYYTVGSMEDMAFELVESGALFGEVPAMVQTYLNYAAIARDLEIDGNYLVTNNGIFEYAG